MSEPIEINAEFCEPEPLQRRDKFQIVLDTLDSLEDEWREAGIDELAEAAAQMSDTMRRWRQVNNANQSQGAN